MQPTSYHEWTVINNVTFHNTYLIFVRARRIFWSRVAIHFISHFCRLESCGIALSVGRTRWLWCRGPIVDQVIDHIFLWKITYLREIKSCPHGTCGRTTFNGWMNFLSKGVTSYQGQEGVRIMYNWLELPTGRSLLVNGSYC